MTSIPATSLWELESDPDMQARFERFHHDNPEVYRLFDQFTRQVVERGFKRFSADMILHRIRWYSQVETHGCDWKINNNWSSRYARLWMRDNPEFDGFFELRKLKA